MLKKSRSYWLALLSGAVLTSTAATATAQTATAPAPAPSTTGASASNAAILDILVKKGVLTPEEAQQVQAQAAQASQAVPGSDIISNPTDKYITRIVLSGRFQTQFEDLSTSINGAPNPASTEHFLIRRVLLGTEVDFVDGFSGILSYDFSNDSFDKLVARWKQSDLLTLDAGIEKAPFGYEENISSGNLRAIERSVITRYVDESNNGRRLGAASYRTGIFASGTADGFFYNVAVTNPERNEYSGDTSSGPTVNTSGPVDSGSIASNNNLAFYGTAGYGAKFDGGSYKVGYESGYLPDQGGPGATIGQGNNLTLNGAYAEVNAGGLNLQGEYETVKDPHGASATKDANPSGYWIQPSYMIVPKVFEGVLRYSYVNSDGRGVNLSDGIRSSPSGGTMDNLSEWYLGANWYIVGNDVKLQLGYIHGESQKTVTGAPAKATTDGVRSEVTVQF